MEAHFNLLGFGIAVGGPAECVEPIAFAYRPFRTDPAGDDTWVRWTDDGVETDRGFFPAVTGVPAIAQLYPRFLDRVNDVIGNHAMIHAGVVVRGGRAVLLAAPASHGKSTLALELASRGWTLYSDDFAPMAFEDGRVHPFPRAVGIVPGSSATPEAYLAAAERSEVELLGKRLVHAGDVGDCANRDAPALPIGDLFLIRGDSLELPRLELACVPGEAGRLAARLVEIAGDTPIERREAGALESIAVAASRGTMSSEALNELLVDPAVLYSSKLWSRRSTWSGDASCEPVVRREAAQWVARELLNRRPGGALLERHGGDTVSLVVDLAAALRSTQCWMLDPGGLARTADTIEAVVAASDSRETTC